MSRVVVTGLGAVSSLGATAGETWRAVSAGRSGIKTVRSERRDRFVCPIAAQIEGFDGGSHFPRKQLSLLDRFAQLAVVAAREALQDAGLAIGEPSLEAASVIVGVGAGGMHTLDDGFFDMYARDARRLHPLTVPKLMASAAPSHVSMDLGIRGPAYAVSSACASGTHAIGLAFRSIRNGEAVVAVSGGADASLTAGTMMAWDALRVLSHDTCRPFSRNRSGLVLGEGAAMLVLENMDHALARRARIYAEVSGFAANSDAGDLTSPDGSSTTRVMRSAIDDARLTPHDIDYVNAHGTATLINDATEAESIRTVFSDFHLPLVSSTKGALGHTLSAAGALEALVTTLALHEQCVPPTTNCTDPDSAYGLDFVPEGARHVRVRHALSNSFAFGGLNAVLTMSRFGDR